MSDEKIQKVLAAAGFDSRRGVEKAIEAKEIFVNGKLISLGARVKPGDKIQWGKRSYIVPEGVAAGLSVQVLLYNKPEGEICSRNDPEGRPTVFDRLPYLKSGRWVSVGRLDFNTSGLLLFTNDGELANKLMHPASEIDREYSVRVQGHVDDETLQRLCDGVLLDDGMAKFTQIARGNEGKGANNWFYCVVKEGRNREVRRLWESQDLRVSRLKRVRYGPILIPSYVRQGQWIELDEKSIKQLYAIAELDVPPIKKPTPQEKEAQQRRIKKLRSGSGAKRARK